MKSNSTIFLIITTLVLAGGAYWYFSVQTDGTESPLTGTIQENQTQTQFKMLVSQLQSISFDTSIFTDPNFMALINLATPVMPEASGRPDPFASIPGTGIKQ
jgi:hypothetical protein